VSSVLQEIRERFLSRLALQRQLSDLSEVIFFILHRKLLLLVAFQPELACFFTGMRKWE